MQYPADLRDVVVRRILAHEISAKEAVDEYGVAHSTVYHWVSRVRKQAASHEDGALTPSDMKKLPLPEGVPLLKMIQADAVCRHLAMTVQKQASTAAVSACIWVTFAPSANS